MSARIIIADDEPLQRIDLRDVLIRRGYQVVGEAIDGLGVIALARVQRPDLVIMDIRMPDVDGIMAAEIVVREKIAPVMVLTGYIDGADMQRIKDIGVSSYLIKPLRESEVVPAVEMALTRHKQYCALEEQIRLLSEQLEEQKRAERNRGIALEKMGISGAKDWF